MIDEGYYATKIAERLCAEAKLQASRNLNDTHDLGERASYTLGALTEKINSLLCKIERNANTLGVDFHKLIR